MGVPILTERLEPSNPQEQPPPAFRDLEHPEWVCERCALLRPEPRKAEARR